MKFTDLMKLKENPAIALLKAWDGVLPVYAYVTLDAEGYRKACDAHQRQLQVEFDNFGEVIATGTGHTPEPIVERFINDYATRLNKTTSTSA